MQEYTHAVCCVGYIPHDPRFETWYEMCDLPDTACGSNWFRDGVRYSTMSSYKSRKTTQYIEAWGVDAEVWTRKCNGALVCPEANCRWNVSKRFLKTSAATDRQCPIHNTTLQAVACGAKWNFYHEIDKSDGKCRHREAVLTHGTDHTHSVLCTAGLTPQSKALINAVLQLDPNITYRQLVSGVGVPADLKTPNSLIQQDPAFANQDLVELHMKRTRKANGKKSRDINTIRQFESAVKSLAGKYVISTLELVRGPTPCVICADDRQLYFLCSHTNFTFQMADNTYAEIAGDWDDWDNHGMDYELMMALAMWRIYGVAKTAEAFAFFLHHLRRECIKRGYNFEWGLSVTCQAVDFHRGQALGYLRHLIEVYGIDEGPQKYIELLTGCGTHLKVSFSKAVQQSEATWSGEDLPDEMELEHRRDGRNIAVDSRVWASLSPDHRKSKMVALAWRRYRQITGIGNEQGDVDHALHELGRMSPVLARWTKWLSNTTVKSLAIPAYSCIEDHIRQAANPNHDIRDEAFMITDNPAEGCHLRRQRLGKHEALGDAIVTSCHSDRLDWDR